MVEGARLESEACEEHRGTAKSLNAHAINELAFPKYPSMSVRKPRCFSRFRPDVSQSYHNSHSYLADRVDLALSCPGVSSPDERLDGSRGAAFTTAYDDFRDKRLGSDGFQEQGRDGHAHTRRKITGARSSRSKSIPSISPGKPIPVRMAFGWRSCKQIPTLAAHSQREPPNSRDG